MILATFFSYKGGAGRSTTCLNTVPYIVEKCGAYSKSPILLLDMDVESAGMTYLLGQQDHFHGKFDVKEFLKAEDTWSVSSAADITAHPLFKNFVPVGNLFGLEDNGSVLFLGVDDRPDANRNVFGGRTEALANKFCAFARNNKLRGIVMDSAAGDQFSARWAVDSGEKLVMCMRPTRQFRIGSFNYLHRLSARYGKSADERSIVLLPTVVPNDAIIDGQSQFDFAVKDFEKRVDDVEGFEIYKDFVRRDMFGINEIARFKWQEDVLYKLDKQGKVTSQDEQEGIKRYKRLAAILCD